ncbi:hypothetical protein [Streptomyces europaeiscabiei]|uniref:hypothetical protein n=1 Tax=Streptomyces europaeiscabiei TaxID=146819 RepID=UPI0029A7B151|nr:hypothetical protein [Streptomyces europaeiscabiei]MDX3840595.1 hypothetical protein [Streptomyces europaeiscabiei]
MDTGECGAAVREFAGEFEIHLTVVSGSGAGSGSGSGAGSGSGSGAGSVAGGEGRIRRWAERHRVKYTRIVLDRGVTPDQPMLTVRGEGGLSAQRVAASVWTGRLGVAGFGVARVKIEAAPWNEDVPRTAVEARALPPGCYFEHHVKLVLADDAEVATVRALAERHCAHVSRNARRELDGRSEPDGRGGRGHERFVTQRCRDVGRPEARRRLDALLDALAGAGFKAVEVEEEFVVHDDRPALDSGWIDEGTGGHADGRTEAEAGQAVAR